MLCRAVLSCTVLWQVPGSKLAIMFDSHNIQHQPQDSQGRFFL
jgi:hypothetical protein